MAKANKQRDRVFLFGAMCAGILCCVTRADPLDTRLASVAAGVGAHSDHAVLPPRIIQAPLADRTPEFTLRDVTALDFGSMWCVLDDDGENLVVTTESSGRIYGALYNLNHERLTEPVELAGPADTGDEGIADHKWIYQDGHHYLTFSISGDGQGGDLYLARFDRDLERTGFVQVLSDAPPTNDMFLVGDGESVSVGKFLPGTGHEVHRFDADLNWLDTVIIGNGPNRHANGASAIFVDDHYHLVAPGTLAPGMNDSVYRIIYDRDWSVAQVREEIIHDPGMITLVTGLSHEPGSDTFLVHYTRDPDDGGGDISRAVFDRDWTWIETDLALEGEFMRPHSVVTGDLLFLSYEDGSNFALRLTSWDITR